MFDVICFGLFFQVYYGSFGFKFIKSSGGVAAVKDRLPLRGVVGFVEPMGLEVSSTKMLADRLLRQRDCWVRC